MRYLIILTLLAFNSLAYAQEWEDERVFSKAGSVETLRILSSTDTVFFEPIIDSFLSENPEISIEYFVTGTASIDKIFRENPDKFDLVVSSAMDLQLKLVNDGFAKRVSGIDHPSWAQWQQSLFGFTMEPAAIVINKSAFEGQAIPQTRQELIQQLRARPDVFKDRLGTYDVRRSGLGYLFATQDARASETYWRLMEVMGGLGTTLYCCSGEMIDDLAQGKIVVAYNVLGSYAEAKQEQNEGIEVILPADFPTTMMRTAIVSNTTNKAESSALFIQHLLKAQSTALNKKSTSLPPLNLNPGQQVISLEPALMTYLDKLKREKFITEWERAVIQ